MYEDDTWLYAVGSNIDEINQLRNNDLIKISYGLASNRLIINEPKTSTMLIVLSKNGQVWTMPLFQFILIHQQC